MIENQNPKFLSLFLPRKFKAANPLVFSVLSKNKEEVEIESKPFPFFTEVQNQELFHAVENRFCLYGKSPLLENLHYSFYFHKKDNLNKNVLVFSRKRKELKKNLLQKQLYNCIKFSTIRRIKDKLFKSRILSTKKKFFSLSFYGKKAALKNSTLLSRKRKSFSRAKFTLIKSFRSYGFLNHFLVKDWKLNHRNFLKKGRNFVRSRKTPQTFSTFLRVLPKKASIHQLLIKK
jgi:hypothetical protein